ncbi:MAG TPA: hypothetical protein VIL74_24510 [Pyrinomonadaceae bacterium]|jgi:hypothetical protein
MSLEASNQTDFKTHAIVDHQQQGIVAGVFLHPADWHADSRIHWNYNHSTMPVVYYARVANPENTVSLEFLPMENFSWTEPETGFYGRGQNVGGTINLPPTPGTDALVRLIIPKYRGDRPNLRIVEADHAPAPEVNPPAGIPPQNVFARKVRVKIEYSENGQTLEEEFRATHLVTNFPPVNNGWNMMYYTGWSLSDICCFRAARGRLADFRETFLKIHCSIKLNPEWVQLANKISQMILQNSKQMADESINAGWQMLEMNGQRIRETAARNQAYIDDQAQRIRESYNAPPVQSDPYKSNSNESEYTAHEAFIDSVREEESIYNPANPANEKVAGYYDRFWTDEFGNITKTNDPNYDPNVGSNRTWTPARKKKIGD